MSNELTVLAKQVEDMAHQLETQDNLLISRETGVQILGHVATLCRILGASKELEAQVAAIRAQYPRVTEEEIKLLLEKEEKNPSRN